MHIGLKISSLRKKRNMTQRELCSGICSITYLSKVENNKMRATHEVLELLSNKLHINIADLVRDESKIFMEELKALHQLIEERETTKVEALLSVLNDQVQDVFDPVMRTAFTILNFEWHILKRDEPNAIQLREDVFKNRKYVNKETKVWYLKAMGFFEYMFGNVKESFRFLNEAKQENDLVLQESGQIEYLLALVNIRIMFIPRALLHAKKALDIYAEAINVKRILDCKLLLGVVYCKIGDYEMAKEYFSNLIKQLTSMNDQVILGEVYSNLGYLYSETNESEKAIDYYNKALAQNLDLVGEIRIQYLLAYEYKIQGETQKALEICKDSLKKADDQRNAYAYKIFILQHFLSDLPDNQIVFFDRLTNEIIPYFESQDPPVAVECYALLGRLLADQQKNKQAACYYEKAIELNFQNYRREFLV